jgi:hypothetical protein
MRALSTAAQNWRPLLIAVSNPLDVIARLPFRLPRHAAFPPRYTHAVSERVLCRVLNHVLGQCVHPIGLQLHTRFYVNSPQLAVLTLTLSSG